MTDLTLNAVGATEGRALSGLIRRAAAALAMSAALIGLISPAAAVEAGRRNDGDVRVFIYVEVASDGTVLSARLDEATLARAEGDGAYRASAEAALRAILRAQKLNLSPEQFPAARYEKWRKFIFTFDPRDMY
jgi:hypothetical protein